MPVATCLGSDQEEDGKGKRSPVHLSSSPEIERKSPEKGGRRLGLSRVYAREQEEERRDEGFKPQFLLCNFEKFYKLHPPKLIILATITLTPKSNYSEI